MDRPAEHLRWLPVENLESSDLVPEFLRLALQELPEYTMHVIVQN